MFRKTISLIALSALLLNIVGLTGCSRTVNIPMEEVSLDSPTNITRLKLKSGSDLTFNEAGGRYKCKTRKIRGITSTGSSRLIPLSVVDSVYFQIGPTSVESYYGAREFHRQETEKHRHKIRGPITGVYKDEQVTKFDGQHGKIDRDGRTISGTTKAGDTLSFSVDNLSGLSTRKSIAPTIITATVYLATAAAVGCLIYLTATPTWK